MSDINFCNTKEQLTHLGEVVTGKVDGSPTGADIDTSTLPYTGQVRKTLPALEQEYLEAIQGAGGVSVGVWASGVTTFNAYNEYAVYNGIPYKPRTATALPYVAQGADPTIAPDDSNVQPYQEITEGQVVALVEETVSDLSKITYKPSTGKTAFESMVAGVPLSAVDGSVVSTGIGDWRITSKQTNVPLDNGLYALPLNGLWGDDFGAIADYDPTTLTGTDSTDAFATALLLCRDNNYNLPTFLAFGFNTKVRVGNGIYGVGDLELQVGGRLAGHGTSSSVLQAIPGASSVIKGGLYNVPPERGSIDDRRQGSISGISILGIPDPTYDNLSVAGRRNKTHLTARGIDLNGAFAGFDLNDVQVMFCDTNIYIEDSWTCKVADITSRDATQWALHMKGPNNASVVERVQAVLSTRGMLLEGDTGGSKPIKIKSSNFEYTLYEGAQILDTPLWEMDGCYFENNSQLTDGVFTSGVDCLIDAVQGLDPLLSDFQISNTLFNSIADTATGVDQLYIKKAKRGRFENVRFGAKDAGQSSAIRIGDIDSVSARNLNIFTPANMMPFKYDTGSDVSVETYPDAPNGNLNTWQQGTTSSLNGVKAADKISVVGGTITRQSFLTDQTSVPGFPLYYANFLASGVDSSITYKVDRREVGNGQIFFGVWLKSTNAASVDLKVIGSYPGSGISTATKTFTLDGVWRFYSIGKDLTRPQANGSINFSVIADSPNEFDVANITYSENFLASSNPSQVVSSKLFEELVVRRIDDYGYSSDTSAKNKVFNMPVPMRSDSPDVSLSGLSTSNCSVVVDSKSANDVVLRVTPTSAGEYSYTGSINVSSFI